MPTTDRQEEYAEWAIIKIGATHQENRCMIRPKTEKRVCHINDSIYIQDETPSGVWAMTITHNYVNGQVYVRFLGQWDDNIAIDFRNLMSDEFQELESCFLKERVRLLNQPWRPRVKGIKREAQGKEPYNEKEEPGNNDPLTFGHIPPAEKAKRQGRKAPKAKVKPKDVVY
jgi:hypothetical protein